MQELRDDLRPENTGRSPAGKQWLRSPLYPSLYQINTRVWLTELSESLGRPATLDDVPDSELERLAALGFDWLWFLSVWTTGEAGRRVSRTELAWLSEYAQTLSDLREEDIVGSGFAITAYVVPAGLGGNAALARLRDRMHRHGLRLMLDFVPNHTGLDHRWVEEHPDFFISGTEQESAEAPRNYIRVPCKAGSLLLAHGRDPYFTAWPDTLQLNYGNAAMQDAMLEELSRVAAACDGVRCDMAMLVLPEVFERTWGRPAQAFWPRALRRVRSQHPGFLFLAEVYWDMERRMQEEGFDYSYDKRLYDRLCQGNARRVRDYFSAGLDYQNKLARFLENHDEPRAAATFPLNAHEAAAVLTYLSPGLRFFHQGQFEGCLKHISPHLVRAPKEPVNDALQRFYGWLMEMLRRPGLREGAWSLLECVPAVVGSCAWDNFVAFSWQRPGSAPLLVVVNYSPHPSQCFVRVRCLDLTSSPVWIKDLLSPVQLQQDGDELRSKGLFLDLPPWGYRVFAVPSEKSNDEESNPAVD
jgi:hypothetical protein